MLSKLLRTLRGEHSMASPPLDPHTIPTARVSQLRVSDKRMIALSRSIDGYRLIDGYRRMKTQSNQISS
jgi:hypothetical protein